MPLIYCPDAAKTIAKLRGHRLYDRRKTRTGRMVVHGGETQPRYRACGGARGYPANRCEKNFLFIIDVSGIDGFAAGISYNVYRTCVHIRFQYNSHIYLFIFFIF